VILYEDHYRRGRAEGEIIGLFRRGLTAAPRAAEIADVQGAVRAVETALQSSRPGELLVLQADVVDETVAFLKQYLQRQATGREIQLNEVLAALRQRLPEPQRVVLGHHSRPQLVT
jgi:cyanophycin synthetase